MPSIYVTRFFQLLTARRFAEAERVLLRLVEKKPRTEWNTGYFQALRGMLLATKSNNDRYNFLSNLNPKSQDDLQRYRREFLRHARNKLHADYDRGFFTAWTSYMRVLAKLEAAMDKTKSKGEKITEVESRRRTEGRKRDKAKSRNQKEKEIKTQPDPEKTEKGKEKAEEQKRKEVEKEIKAKTGETEVEELEKAKGTQPRQSTLFDYPK